jgi:hypothetical protein
MIESGGFQPEGMADLGQRQRWKLSVPHVLRVIRFQIHMERNSSPARFILMNEI